jgi:FMN reductase
MSRVVLLSASPSENSKTEALLEFIARRLGQYGHRTEFIKLRHLPAGPLLAGDGSDGLIASARATVAAADAVVVGSPVFKATYTGLLKVFIDLLPMDALHGKPVLPLLTGGSPAHVLALDYGLKPLLATLGASSIGRGRFVLSSEHPPGHGHDPAEHRRVRRTRRRRRHRPVRLRTDRARPVLHPRRGGRRRIPHHHPDHDRQEPLMSVHIATTLTPDPTTGPATAKTLDGHADFALVTDDFTGFDAIEFASWLGPLTGRLGHHPRGPRHPSRTLPPEHRLGDARLCGPGARGPGRGHLGRPPPRRPSSAAATRPRRVDAWAEAASVIDVIRRLWDSWDDDAIIRDRATDRYIDRDRLHYIEAQLQDSTGADYSVLGPSITPRPPQGHPPIIVRAEAGNEAARAAADIVLVDEAAGTVSRSRICAPSSTPSAGAHRPAGTDRPAPRWPSSSVPCASSAGAAPRGSC